MQDTQNSANDREKAGEVRTEQTAPARREVLATIGRFAYVAPALALLAEPKFAHAGYGRGGGKGGGWGKKHHYRHRHHHRHHWKRW
jgi:hypothetical protein